MEQGRRHFWRHCEDCPSYGTTAREACYDAMDGYFRGWNVAHSEWQHAPKGNRREFGVAANGARHNPSETALCIESFRVPWHWAVQFQIICQSQARPQQNHWRSAAMATA